VLKPVSEGKGAPDERSQECKNDAGIVRLVIERGQPPEAIGEAAGVCSRSV
jgi:hypothetical protein